MLHIKAGNQNHKGLIADKRLFQRGAIFPSLPAGTSNSISDPLNGARGQGRDNENAGEVMKHTLPFY